MFTVLTKNSMLGTSHYVGNFATSAAAEDYASRQKRQMRSFAGFELWTGTSRNPGRFVRDLGYGEVK